MTENIEVQIEFDVPAGADDEDAGFARWHHPANDSMLDVVRTVTLPDILGADGGHRAWRLSCDLTASGGGPAESLAVLIGNGTQPARIHRFPLLLDAGDLASVVGRRGGLALWSTLLGQAPDPPPQPPAHPPLPDPPEERRGLLSRVFGRAGDSPAPQLEVDPMVTVHFDRTPVHEGEDRGSLGSTWQMRGSRGTGELLERIRSDPRLLPADARPGGWLLSVVGRDREVHEHLGALDPLAYLNRSADGAESLWPVATNQWPFLNVLAVRDVDLWVFAEYLPGEPVPGLTGPPRVRPDFVRLPD